MSNTSKGRGEKGSKFWMQTLVNLGKGSALTKEIQKVNSSVGVASESLALTRVTVTCRFM